MGKAFNKEGKTMMHGWKTWAGAGLIAAAAVLNYFGYVEIAKLVLVVGGSLGLIGLGHKIEKSKFGR